MKKVIITGATSGVGEELVQRFCGKGWKVAGLGRNEEKLKKLEDSYADSFIGIKADVKSEQSVSDSFNFIGEKFNQIDLFVNNAAVFKMEEFEKCSIDDINSIVDTNLKGAMYCTLHALALLKSSGNGGRIVNIASVAATHGILNQSIYCASKYGLLGFAEALNQEIIKDNISITTICPGGIDTPLWNDKNPYPPGDKTSILKPADIADLVEYVSGLESRIILKNLTLFPSGEWH